MTDGLISTNYGAADQTTAALKAEEAQLDQLTTELNARLKQATWVSQSEASFAAAMAKYNAAMGELKDELRRLAVALGAAAGSDGSLQTADKDAAKQFPSVAVA